MPRSVQNASAAAQKSFERGAIRNIPHHTLLAISAKHTAAAPLLKYLSAAKRKQLAKYPLKSYPEAEVQEYLSVAAKAELWHGTGRYQYGTKGVVDVLKSIVEHGGLTPKQDVYAVFSGGKQMESLSATPLRMIARSYADTHGKGKDEPNRYGSALWWVSYFYGKFYAELFLRRGIAMTRMWRKWQKLATDANGEITWGKKANRQAAHVWDVFTLGSDIRGNYPVLIGMTHPAKTAVLDKVFAKAEVRIVKTANITDFSHIEVPEAKVPEVASLLKAAGYIVPVFPIEIGEYAASLTDFHALLVK